MRDRIRVAASWPIGSTGMVWRGTSDGVEALDLDIAVEGQGGDEGA